VTLNELKGKYTRLSNEIDALAGAGERNEARLMRLMNELDQVHGELVELRRRTLSAPTLRDAVAWAQPMPMQAAALNAAMSMSE